MKFAILDSHGEIIAEFDSAALFRGALLDALNSQMRFLRFRVKARARAEKAIDEAVHRMGLATIRTR